MKTAGRPTLYHKGKNGKIHSWRIWTEKDTIFTEHGTVDGKKQISSQVATPKNVGKKNATTANEQATIEADAMHKYKLDRKYSLTPEKTEEPKLMPMLAQEFDKRLHKDVVFPGYVQRKYDGVRCLARWNDKHIELISRNGKPYNCPHIVNQLQQCMPKGLVLDGELYVHGVGFQTVTSWVKKLQPDTQKIEYHIYDIPEIMEGEDFSWEKRLEQLKAFETQAKYLKVKNIVFVPTYKVNNEQEVRDYQAKFVDEGFEGAIFRNAHGLYRYDYRSYDLLKVKSFNDEEFEIVGFTEGKGKDKETVIWICKTDKGEIFNVRSADTYENRKEYFQNAHQYVGRMLSVKYFGVSDEGIPRFPVGLGFKEDR
jgi:ATP-dependent DNA ligase